MRILVFLISLFVISTSFSQSKNYAFKHISTKDGLSQSSVIAIHQDKFGQLWVGTRDGLNKYDGHKITIYRNSETDSTSIINNDILSILEDSEGFIWIGTYKGLNKYNPKKDTFTRFTHNKNSNSLSNNAVWAIQEFGNEIWFGTSNGLSIFDKKTEIFTNVFHQPTQKSSLVNSQIRAIYQDSKNQIWIGTKSGLSKLIKRNKSTFTFDNYQYSEIDNQKSLVIQQIIEAKNKSILLATENHGLLKIENDSNEIKPFQKVNLFKSKNVRRLVYDDKNNLWIGTYKGLYIIDKNEKSTLLQLNNISETGFSNNSIKSLYKDKKGSIWIGSYYGGLHLWDEENINFINYNQQNGLSFKVVSSIQKTENNQLFFGTEGGGISVLDLKNNTSKTINRKNYPKLSNDNIKSLLLTEKNKLWIGTFKEGLNLFDTEKQAFINNQIPKLLQKKTRKFSIYNLKIDVENQLWIGTLFNGLIRFDLKDNNHQQYRFSETDSNTISNNFIRDILIDSKNNVWIASQKGISKIENSSKIKRFFYDDKVAFGDDILSVFEDSNKTIWVGTKAKGLHKFNGNTFEKVQLKSKENTITAVHTILEETKNTLWISTNQGIVKYNIDNQETQIYNQKDGIIDNEFNDNASLKTANNTFYFGSPSGITSFNATTLVKNKYAPQVLITDFSIKNESVSVKDKQDILSESIQYTNDIVLNHQQGNFTIAFSIPNYINPENNSYQYRLKGLQENWTTTNKNTASYTIQNAGNYVFEVKGANSDGVWNKNSTMLNINVNPAPWKSWWAFLLYAIVIGLSLYYLISASKTKTKLQQELSFEHLENERIEENNKAKLEFFTNISHEFRTPLTLILGPLQQVLKNYQGSSKMFKKLLVVENSAKHLLTLINRLMDFRKLEKNLFSLEAAEGNIVKFLREIYLSFSEYAKDGDYDYSFHTTNDEILVYYDRYKLERVFYNLISNAFRYTPKNGTIAVRVKTDDDNIIITVEDSGVGISEEFRGKIFERFFEVDANNKTENNYNKGTGIGLSIAKNIVKLHKGKINVKNNSNAVGSVFSVSLPLGKNHLSSDEILKDFKFSDDVSQYITQLENSNIIIEDELEDQIKDENKKTILLVEDNKPLRAFMKDLLKKEYNILEAENGKAALKMASKHLPNLIVSDVVMPVMVGTELCAEIKKEIKTSHIPIILLTSRTSLVYKLEGLESGADDYLSKPFDVNEFQLRIKNLLNTSNRLKQKFSGDKNLLPNEVIVSSLDEKLFKKALEIVEENIANDAFDIPYFCSELGVSRTMLFVKIKAWTNFTPNDFIQHFRMKRAAQLLEQGKINISEVSYKVGFKNPKYFSKCFQKKYGETPSKYAKKFSES